MEDLPALSPSATEVSVGLVYYAITLAVAVASYRRSRCLSGFPIWKSVGIGIISGAFWMLWLVVSFVNRDRLRQEWAEYRRERAEHDAVAI